MPWPLQRQPACQAYRAAIAATALVGLALSLPDFVQTLRDNIIATPQPPDAKVFAQKPELWAAMRQDAGGGSGRLRLERDRAQRGAAGTPPALAALHASRRP